MGRISHATMVDGKRDYKWKNVKPFKLESFPSSGSCSSLTYYNRDEDYFDDSHSVINKYVGYAQEEQ